MKFNIPLFEEFEGNSGSGGAGSLYGHEPAPDTSTQQVEPPVEEPATPPSSGSNFDPQQITAAIAEGFRQGQGANQPPSQPKLTLEQIRQQTGYPTFDPQSIRDLFGDMDDDTANLRMAALQKRLIDPLVQHTLSLTNIIQSAALKPYEQHLQQQRAEAFQKTTNDFTSSVVKSNPALKGMEQVVTIAINNLLQSGYVEQDSAKATKRVLEEVTRLAKAVNPNFTLTQQAGAGGSTKPSMAGSVNGGGAGGGAGGGSNKPRGASALYPTPKI